MRLLLDLTRDDAARLRRYATPGPGGFQSLSRALLVGFVARPDGSGFVLLKSWPHIAAFQRRRDLSGPGGFQSLLKRLPASLMREGAPTLTSWPEIRAELLRVKRRHGGQQLDLLAS